LIKSESKDEKDVYILIHSLKFSTIFITDHAQDHLGDVVYVKLPEVGATMKQGDNFGVVEIVKATGDTNSLVSRKVIQVNEELSSSLALMSFLPNS